jgi:uncharacterized caspase-like protein
VQHLKQTYGSGVDFKSYILTNENATKNKIQSFLNNGIFSYIDKETDVFIYFSGHGMLIPDNDGDESDDDDEVLIPYDYNESNYYNTVILDDDLYTYYQKIGKNTRKTFVIIDSCFSGGSMKSPIIPKGIHLPYTTKSMGNLKHDGMEDEINASDNFLFLSASLESQPAWPNIGGLSYSLFTHAFVKALDTSSDKNSDGLIQPTELYNAIKNEMTQVINSYHTKLQSQEPVLLNPANIDFTIPVGR